MIAPRTMIDLVTAEPFQPFRIHMASGTSFDVGHPEMIRVGRSSVTVHMRPDANADAPSQWREVSLMLLEYVEPLDSQSADKQSPSQN